MSVGVRDVGAMVRSSEGATARSFLRARDLFPVLLAALAVALLALIAVDVPLVEHRRVLWIATGASGLVLIAGASLFAGLDWLSATVIYAAVFWLFHYGLVLPVGLDPGLLDWFRPWDVAWVEAPETQKAALLSLLFLACFFLGACLAGRRSTRRLRKGPPVPAIVLAGWICLLGGVAIYGQAVAQYGIGVFRMSYGDFAWIQNPFTYGIYLASLGLMLQIAGGRPLRRVLITAAILWLPLILSVMLTGERNSPMVSLVVLVVVMARRGFRPSLALLLAGAIGLLALISVVRAARMGGLLETFASDGALVRESALPVRGVMELGFSLRPVYVVIEALQEPAEDYRYGATYVYSLYRRLMRTLGEPLPDVSQDPYILNEWVQRAGPIGFSTVAEAYINGGTAGVVLFSLAWGYFLRLLERKAGSACGLAVLAVVMIPMTLQIRNDFIFVPFWILVGLSALGGSALLWRGLRWLGRSCGALRPGFPDPRGSPCPKDTTINENGQDEQD
ncbi:MAG: O-antigen polysaccharide polymerase Wzy [Chloroflexi bacterium]|nr:O-antigen polysaccharide polymerase Wzy [Chloroflexota bacterium]